MSYQNPQLRLTVHTSIQAIARSCIIHWACNCVSREASVHRISIRLKGFWTGFSLGVSCERCSRRQSKHRDRKGEHDNIPWLYRSIPCNTTISTIYYNRYNDICGSIGKRRRYSRNLCLDSGNLQEWFLKTINHKDDPKSPVHKTAWSLGNRTRTRGDSSFSPDIRYIFKTNPLQIIQIDRSSTVAGLWHCHTHTSNIVEFTQHGTIMNNQSLGLSI